jgi:hydrogenase maturation factor
VIKPSHIPKEEMVFITQYIRPCKPRGNMAGKEYMEYYRSFTVKTAPWRNNATVTH